MTAQHPQTNLEYIQKLYRDQQARLHTPPSFAPAATQTEAAEQQVELAQWELQERYGKPLTPYAWKLARNLLILWTLLLGIPLAIAVATQAQGDYTPVFTILLPFLMFLALLTWALWLPSSPERYYGSPGMRGWATTLRWMGKAYLALQVAKWLNPRPAQPQAVRQPGMGYQTAEPYLTATDVTKVQLVDSEGFYIPINRS